MRHLIYRTLLAASLISAGAVHAASDFTVLNGTWVVTSEVNGQPGRGMALDVQNGILVMQVYNYDAQGEPTFHMTSGAIQDNQFVGPLNRYRGGRYYGGPARSAVAEGSVGNVEVRFSNAHSGTVQFPGETPVAISRFDFEDIPKSAITQPGTTQAWSIAQLNEQKEPIDLWYLSLYTERLADGSLRNHVQQVRSRQGGVVTNGPPCTYAEAEDYFQCKVKLGSGTATMQLRPKLGAASGTLINDQYANVRHQLAGARIFTLTPPGAQLSQESEIQFGAFGSQYFPQPNPGTWIVSSELDGAPGRGMAIDVQQGTLVLQVYNYEQNGAGTFHMATAPFTEGKAKARLIRYSGGRYFGSGPKTGYASGDAGEVTLSFSSTTRGTIRFPGEPEVAIHRYEFSMKPNPQLSNLLGSWAFLDIQTTRFVSTQLTTIANNRASSADGMQCHYEDAATGAVRCSDILMNTAAGPFYLADYRFTPGVDGRGIGISTVIDDQGRLTAGGNPVLAMRVKSGDGALVGSGPLAGSPAAPGTQDLEYDTEDDNHVKRPTKSVVTLPNTNERRPVVLIGQGWGGSGNVVGAQSVLATQLAAAGYVAVDVGFNEIAPWTSDLPYSARSALDKLCISLPQRANCDAIIWNGTSYSGTQGLIVTNYLRNSNRNVLGFLSQDAGYTLSWGVPNHANLSQYSVALIENMGDMTFPVNACSDGNCGARERATFHRNNGVNLDKIVSWCPAGGDHGTRDNVPGGAQAWDNWVLSAIKSMLHVQRGVPTFTGYTPPNVALSNACAAP